jgi:uncharacterized protein DUF4160
MPEICRFFGIIITMYYQEHNPAYFHVRYNEYKASISIKNLALIDGKLPPKVLGLVIEWASQHQQELLQDWELAAKYEELKVIEPLE